MTVAELISTSAFLKVIVFGKFVLIDNSWVCLEATRGCVDMEYLSLNVLDSKLIDGTLKIYTDYIGQGV